MRQSTAIAAVAVVWATLVLLRAVANGFDFNGGAYGNGQKAALVLAALVLVVGGRELLKARRRSPS
jgi:hypothetical protein